MKGNSFATVASQVLNLNKNLIEALGKFDQIATESVSDVNIKLTDTSGNEIDYKLPSFGYLNQELQRLNNNINTLFGINEDGALIQTSENRWRKIILVDINKEPNSIGELETINNFEKSQNYFFNALLNPSMKVRFNLDGVVDDDTRKIKVRKYITKFQKREDGTLTEDAQRAVGQFDNRFKNSNSILLNDYLEWYATTPGLVNPSTPEFIEETINLQPNSLLFDGIFSVIQIVEDSINQTLWYELNTLDYNIIETNQARKLETGDRLTINREQTSTLYEIEQISTAFSSPRVKLRRLEGNEAIPVGIGSLKLFSGIRPDKSLMVNIGFDQRVVIFAKPISSTTYIQARFFSLGTGLHTSDLILSSDDSDNGKTLNDFYREKVDDYGLILKDIIKKQKPTPIGIKPDIPILLEDNFRVVQINEHLTNSTDRKKLIDKFTQLRKVKSEISSLDGGIAKARQEVSLSATSLGTKSLNSSLKNKVNALIDNKQNKSKLLKSLSDDVISLTNSPSVTLNIDPKYRVRGFWEFPLAKLTLGSKPQEVIQFKVEYRYLSKSGNQARIENFTLKGVNNQTISGAAFSNWEIIKTDIRTRVYNPETDEYTWEIEDVSDADTPNINQLDIPISKNEKVQIRIKSVSEVGYPDSPIESDWSEILEIPFPDDLESIVDDTEFILQEANREESIINLRSSLDGIDDLLNARIIVGDKNYLMTTEDIITNEIDTSGTLKSLHRVINDLNSRMDRLEEIVNRVRGIMEVFIYRNDEEFRVKNNEDLTFNVECEEYLEPYNQFTNITGRVYVNQIYTVKDFYVRVVNTSNESPLGLLSNREYSNNSEVFSQNTPQVFWVNERDDIIFDNRQGQTRTQKNNQFIWSVNFDSGDSDNNISKISENIGNTFLADNSNSLTEVLSSTEHNLGYSETSILNFNGNNNSLMEVRKWVDDTQTGTSENKLLTSVHPSIQSIDDIVELNSERIKTFQANDELIIPLNIYFKLNALNPTSGQGENFEFINLNEANTTTRHIKKVKFLFENETENKPFIFKVKFNINRNRISSQARQGSVRTNITSRFGGGVNRRR